MKLLVLDGMFGNNHDGLLEELLTRFKGYEAETFSIRDKKMAFCTGCWSCWTKTPGKCAHMDDTQEMLRKVINSDLVVMFTENSVGYMTSNSKKALDKFVPLVHPYIELVDGECHHIKRYDKYPKIGLIYVDDEQNNTDFESTKHLMSRAALNFKSELTLALHLTSNKEELKYESFNF